jgi:hypothetical protein
MKISNIDDVRSLIDNEIEESTELEYKRKFADDKNRRREDIAKDVSAMANANGGIIIYGLNEKEGTMGHSIPEKVTPISVSIMSKDQLTQIISSNISPKIKDIEITYLPVDDENGVFVVKIPKSNTAHQSLPSHYYYIRRNATIEIMEDYEIRDIMNRLENPQLRIDGCSFYKNKTDDYSKCFVYNFIAKIINIGNSVCQIYKLNVYFNKITRHCNINLPSHEGYSYTILDLERAKVSCNSREPIFEGETIDIGQFKIEIDKGYEQEFEPGLIIDMILFFPKGSFNIAYIPSEQRYVEGRENIDKLLGRDKRIDYPMLEIEPQKRN